MKESSPPPVYKPTPINLLNSLLSTDYAQNESSNNVYSIPVYHPTPIDELDKYSPALANCSEFYSPIPMSPRPERKKIPTYSPVLPTSNCFKKPEVDPMEFQYCQPSPAYPPAIIPAGDIDEGKLNLSKSSFSQIKRLSNEEFAMPCSIPKKCAKSTISHKQKMDKDSVEKREKILSLYYDLYEEENDTDSATIETSSSSKCNQSKHPTTQRRIAAPNSMKNCQLSDNLSVKKSNEPSPTVARPLRPLRSSSKIPMPIRIRYLDHFIEACLRVCSSKSDAYTRALNEEQTCHDSAANRLVYLNAVIKGLKLIKSEPAYVAQVEKIAPKSSTVKKKITGIVEQPVVDLDNLVKGQLFYDELVKFLLTEDQLVSNSYPRLDTEHTLSRGRASIKVPDSKRIMKEACSSNQLSCARCAKFFTVNKFGEPTVKERCTYHWGKSLRQRIPGTGIDFRYSCCQAESGQQGCQIALHGHVFDTNKWYDLDGFVETLPALPPSMNSPAQVKVYAVDCEMVYTLGGLELGRVTIVDTHLDTVMDKIVRPNSAVVDANTRFSGLKLSDFESASCRITDIQMELLHLWDADTILIGHSLESDLTALKIIHNKVVDTSLVFPHRRGLPYKRALRTITAEVLEKIIQEDASGHDCKEDATSCMLLMQHKVKEILRKRLHKSPSSF